MKIQLGLISLATGTLLLAAVAGCGDNDAPSPVEPSTSTTADSTPSPSATSPSDAARDSATAAVRNYFTVLDEIRRDPASKLATLPDIATSTQLTALQHLVETQRQEGERQVGTTAINELTVQSVSIDNSDPATGKVPAVVIDVCWDVSQVDLVDKSGTSVVSPDRPDTGWTRYTVANYDYAADPDDGWRVATGKDLKQTPCAAT